MLQIKNRLAENFYILWFSVLIELTLFTVAGDAMYRGFPVFTATLQIIFETPAHYLAKPFFEGAVLFQIEQAGSIIVGIVVFFILVKIVILLFQKFTKFTQA